MRPPLGERSPSAARRVRGAARNQLFRLTRLELDLVGAVLNREAICHERREGRRILEHKSVTNHARVVFGEEFLRRALRNNQSVDTGENVA